MSPDYERKTASTATLLDLVDGFMQETAQHLNKRLGGSKGGVMKAGFPKWKIGASTKDPSIYDVTAELTMQGATLHFDVFAFDATAHRVNLVKKGTATVDTSAEALAEVIARAYEASFNDLY